jgi:hypothetical protein
MHSRNLHLLVSVAFRACGEICATCRHAVLFQTWQNSSRNTNGKRLIKRFTKKSCNGWEWPSDWNDRRNVGTVWCSMTTTRPASRPVAVGLLAVPHIQRDAAVWCVCNTRLPEVFPAVAGARGQVFVVLWRGLMTKEVLDHSPNFLIKPCIEYYMAFCASVAHVSVATDGIRCKNKWAYVFNVRCIHKLSPT